MLQGVLFYKSAIRALVSSFFKERKEIQTCLPPFSACDLRMAGVPLEAL